MSHASTALPAQDQLGSAEFKLSEVVATKNKSLQRELTKVMDNQTTALVRATQALRLLPPCLTESCARMRPPAGHRGG